MGKVDGLVNACFNGVTCGWAMFLQICVKDVDRCAVKLCARDSGADAGPKTRFDRSGSHVEAAEQCDECSVEKDGRSSDRIW